MKYILRISGDLKAQVRHLPPDLKRLARGAFDDILKKPETGKPLSEDLEGYRSYRIGRYRLIYRIQGDRLVMEAFGPRSRIYERFVIEIARRRIREHSARYGSAASKLRAVPEKRAAGRMARERTV